LHWVRDGSPNEKAGKAGVAGVAKTLALVASNGGGYAFSEEAHPSHRYGNHIPSIQVRLDNAQRRRARDEFREARELSDRVTRKLVEVARAGVVDLDTLRDRALAEIMRP
jgi:hypothetical protein